MEFTGFHRIERDLWVDGLQPDTAAMADRLMADVTEIVDAGQGGRAQPAAARQRLQGAARRGRGRQDHRRGGPLLAHRPLGLPGERRRLAGGDRLAAPGARGARPRPVATLDERFARAGRAARDAPRRRRLQALHRAQPRTSHGAVRRARRGERAGQPGRRRGGRASDRAVPAARAARGSAGAGAAAGRRRRWLAGAVLVAADGARGAPSAARLGRRRRPVLRHAPGRHRHAGPGPHALRRARRPDRQPGRAASTCCSDGPTRRADDRRRRGDARRRDRRHPGGAAVGHRRGARPARRPR